MDFQIEFLYSKFLQSSGVSIDTRTLAADNLFFAISGPNFNGNHFAEQAILKGASFAVVDDPQYNISEKTIYVEDSLAALQALAKFHRSRFRRPVVGLTGSNGKTTTKELINAVLSKKFITHSTQGNLNNHLGVPLTILGIHPQVEVAIIEMGANAVGEIANLCQIAQPTHGLITNIGKAHLEGFGGIEGIIRGKSELYDFLLKNEGEVFINTQDPVLDNMKRRFSSPYLVLGENSYIGSKLLEASPYIKYENEVGEIVETQISGVYNFGNIAYALALGKYFGVPSEAAHEAIRAYIPSNNRSQIIKQGGVTIIMDAYNANPDSIKAALDNLAKIRGSRSVVLGDMLELGEYSAAEHKAVAEKISRMDLDEIYLVGEQMQHAKNMLAHAIYFTHPQALIDYFKQKTNFNGTWLIKGSRGMALEQIVPFIR